MTSQSGKGTPSMDASNIEAWLNELARECEAAEWDHVYKEGWTNALTAVLIKMDAHKRAANARPASSSSPGS